MDEKLDTTPAAEFCEALRRASAEAAKLPQWMHDAVAAMLAEVNRPDPCHCPRACETAQTCVEGCVYGR